MRDPKRITRVVWKLWRYWRQHPDLRLGQILVNFIRVSEPVPMVFYYEDSELEAALDQALQPSRIDLRTNIK